MDGLKVFPCQILESIFKTILIFVSGAGGEFEESELPVLIYNMALAAFLQKQFCMAEKLLEQVL